MDYQAPETTNIESEWVPTVKAMLYEKECIHADIDREKPEKKLNYQVKIPMKGYKLCDVPARNAQDAKRKADALSSEITHMDNYLYISGKAVSAVATKQPSEHK